jgi:type I restriction enzyme R subunit
MAFNEDTRVKIPAILHLCKLGYQYLSLKNCTWDENTNIFTDIFINSLVRINSKYNSEFDEDDAFRILQDVKLSLENEDLGKAFYHKLISKSGMKIIDFEDFSNNSLHVVTELTYKNGEEEFRPDITLLINGLPLAFIEVKKPNNRDGIVAERERINRRFSNKKFQTFVNITQMMVFSNNMEYDNNDIEPLQGAYYAASSYHNPDFNYFSEEEKIDFEDNCISEYDELENDVLKDNNLAVIKQSPEFLTNKNPNSPTNRILTSLFSKERLAFFLEYGFAYVTTIKGIEKHIMRYPQFFAARAIKNKLEQGVKKGIIWHTQGSGKTALAYFSVKYLTDYFQKKQIVPKFYFIVDRIDLLKQAKKEFSSRGLIVHLVNSKEEFVKDIKTTTALHNHSGKPEMTVINIQKFSEESNVASKADYNVNIQRIYFLDEVHRSYNPQGSFLANLTESDPNSIKIGLTGTPLISEDYYSRDLFGNYIHKYYYNASIADGYTLRLIREEIASDYKVVLKNALSRIKTEKGEFQKTEVFSHPTFVEPMLDYIINDFERSRITFSDASIGAMVVCDSAPQAKMMFEIFTEKYSENARLEKMATDKIIRLTAKWKQQCEVKKAALILYDVGTKEEKDDWIEDFKNGDIDILFVFNMLLTGFDAKRLKKLYLGRVVKRHNLLQTLTRVNRKYNHFRYGYVVDFADIQAEFDATNKAYFDELQLELGEELQHYSNLFKSKEEMVQEIEEIKEVLFPFNTENAELFSQQINQIESREEILKIKKALENAKGLYNIIRLLGYYELLEKIDFLKLNTLYKETINHLALLNSKEALENDLEHTNILNIALEDVIFHFTKISEEELILADELRNTLRQTREAFAFNFDKKDPDYISLYEELKRLFKMKKLDEVTQDEMKANIGTLQKIYGKIRELNRKNNLIKSKFNEDAKFARIHKRLLEKKSLTQPESAIYEALKQIKARADMQVLQNTPLLKNENYFSGQMMLLVIDQLQNKNKFKINAESSKYINNLVVKEYLDEFYGRTYYESTV